MDELGQRVERLVMGDRSEAVAQVGQDDAQVVQDAAELVLHGPEREDVLGRAVVVGADPASDHLHLVEVVEVHPPDGALGTDGLIERFLAGRSPNTRQAYADDLADFAAWLGLAPPAAVAQLLDADGGAANGLALDYLNHLRELGRSRATVNRRLAALRSLVKLARLLGLVTWSIEVSGGNLTTVGCRIA